MIFEHIDGAKVSAQFSWENEMRYRYRLEVTLKDAAPASKTVCAVMQNPSYAGENVAAKSVQFVEKVVFTKGLLGGMKQKTLFKTRMHQSRGRYDGFIQPYAHADCL